VLTGSGQLRAQLLDSSLCGLAVWDPVSAVCERGGSASVVSLWETRGIPGRARQPRHLRQEAPARTAPALPVDDPAGEPGSYAGAVHRIKALLFADAVGYSQLTETRSRAT